MADEEFVVVCEGVDQVEAQIVRSILEEAGIPVIERPVGAASLSAVIGAVSNPLSELAVPSADVERARTLIDEYRREAVTVELPAEEGEEVEAAPVAQPNQQRGSCGQVMLTLCLLVFLVLLIMHFMSSQPDLQAWRDFYHHGIE